jgi:uncharacterized cupin superfamily protein
LGAAAGLVRIGINLQRLPPGTRSSWPHAEECEEEFVYVIEGEVNAWIDGDLHRMVAGDLAAFPAGTGICHCFINNTGREALLLVGGEAAKPDNRIMYPLNLSRRADLQASQWWTIRCGGDSERTTVCRMRCVVEPRDAAQTLRRASYRTAGGLETH